MQVDHYFTVYMAKPVSDQWQYHPMEFMCWQRTGLSDHHGYGCCVYKMTRAMFILTFVNLSKSVTTFTLPAVKTKSRSVLLMDLRKLFILLSSVVLPNIVSPMWHYEWCVKYNTILHCTIQNLEALWVSKPLPRQLITQNSYNCPYLEVVKIPLINSWIRNSDCLRLTTKI